MFTHGNRPLQIIGLIGIVQLTMIAGVRIALLFAPALLLICVAFNLLLANRSYLDAARAHSRPPEVADAEETATNTDISARAVRDLTAVVRWARTCRSLPAVYASVFIVVAMEIGILLQSHHPQQSVVIAAITAVPVLMLVRILTAVSHPTQLTALECIHAVRTSGLVGITPLIEAVRYLRESVRPEADARLTALLIELDTYLHSEAERKVILRLAGELPHLSPACCLAAFGFFERSEATCVLPQLNAYLRQLHRRNDSSELITSAEHCAAVLTKLSAASSQKDTLLRSGQPGNHTATLLRAEQPRQKEEASLNTAPPGKSLND